MSERGKFARASFLVMLIGILIFLYAQTFTQSVLFPQDTENWNKIYTGYLVIASLTLIGLLAYRQTRALVQANYWKSLVFKFIPSAIVTTIVLILLKVVLRGTGSVNLFSAIAYMPIGILITHAFVVSQIEELLFGGLLYTSIEQKSGKNIADIGTALLFAIFHFAKTGGNWIIMLTYIPLRYAFNYVRNNGYPLLNRLPRVGQTLFGPTPQTQQSNAGMHFGWNAFVIGLVPQ